MLRIATPNSVPNLFGAGKNGYQDGNKALAINPTELNAAVMNAMQEEISAVPEYVGMALSPGNNHQLLAAILALIEANAGNYALDTGAANAYVVAMSPAISAYTANVSGSFKAAHANTGASTLNFGAGVVTLVNDVGVALVAGDISIGSIVGWEYVLADNKCYITSMVQSQMVALAMGIGLKSSGVGVYAASATLTAADFGRAAYYGGGGNGTLTLPAANAGPVGSIISVYVESTGSCTLARAGAATIYAMGLTAQTAITLYTGESVQLQTDGANWNQVGGMLGFGSSLSTNGYQKLPSGLIIQWATQSITITSTNYNFPIAFPNGCKAIAISSQSATNPVATAPVSTTQYSATAGGGTTNATLIFIGN